MYSNNIKIRSVRPIELDKLQAIGRQTFTETFANENSESDMESYLTENFNGANVKSEFENPDSKFYFAEIDDLIIGYLKLNTGFAQTESAKANSLEVERIYVLNEFHGKQVGQGLYNKALNVAESSGVDFLWLGVWENNLRAIRFYEKNGFIKFGEHVFTLGTDNQTDIMMKLELKKA